MKSRGAFLIIILVVVELALLSEIALSELAGPSQHLFIGSTIGPITPKGAKMICYKFLHRVVYNSQRCRESFN